jgi:flagellum-specific peptidoglycan hydrolase FlgJ
VHSLRKQRWQQATALVSLSTCGAMTGIAFAHGTVAELTSPSSMPAHLLAVKKPGASAPAGESALRASIVRAANYYLRLAQGKTPAEMEALIWQNDSMDGADHGSSCAAFASLTLEAGAQAVGQESWVTGGTSYPWPLHGWADVRVDPNSASPGIISILQDAEAHDRWHPLGDGYTPQPGDWVLFAGHVEVVTKYSGGVLYTIGGDSMPNMSVNAHQYSDPLGARGVQGFVNNGDLLSAVSPPLISALASPPAATGQAPVATPHGQAAIPGLVEPAFSASTAPQAAAPAPSAPPTPTAPAQAILPAAAAIPGAQPITGSLTGGWAAPPDARYSRNAAPAGQAAAPGTTAQQAFISQIAPAAVAAQKKYGIPAAVTIAQAIDESGWGQSVLAARYHNLFGIKGTGPAGSVMMPTQEYQDGAWVTVSAPFRVYRNLGESIDDHSLLLATGSVYQQAMADRQDPDAFANDLTGVYATDPGYGASLISLMRQDDLYRYDSGAAAPGSTAGESRAGPGASIPGATGGAEASIPGLVPADTVPPPLTVPLAADIRVAHAPPGNGAVKAGPRTMRVSTRRYLPQMPQAVTTDFVTTAKISLLRAQPLYQDVADGSGIRWELLAACDWMQCKAQPRYSPVGGEKLGTRNSDGTIYRTKAEALEQCAADLITLASAVYRVDLTARLHLAVWELARVFAAFRWGGLLKAHHVSAMEFPYSVAGLTSQHMRMRWPDIPAQVAPDRPGTRFRESFGAVPVVLALGYRAVA